jgi:hypothetical protein
MQPTFKTSAEIAEENRQAELQRQHAEREAATIRQRNTDLAEQRKERDAENARAMAEEEETTLAQRGRELAAGLQNARGDAAALKAQLTTEREGRELIEQAESLAASIADRPLAEAHAGEVERLARLQTLAALWPTRKKLLTDRLAATEADIARLEKQLAETTSLFSKAQAALAKLLKGGATA